MPIVLWFAQWPCHAYMFHYKPHMAVYPFAYILPSFIYGYFQSRFSTIPTLGFHVTFTGPCLILQEYLKSDNHSISSYTGQALRNALVSRLCGTHPFPILLLPLTESLSLLVSEKDFPYPAPRLTFPL